MTKAEKARQDKLLTTLKGMMTYYSAMCNNARDEGNNYRAGRAHDRAYAIAQFIDLLTYDDYLDHYHTLYKEYAIHYEAEHSGEN